MLTPVCTMEARAESAAAKGERVRFRRGGA